MLSSLARHTSVQTTHNPLSFMKKAKILIVEEEVLIAREIENSLRNLRYEVTAVVDTGESAIQKAGTEGPDLVLIDIHINGEMDGIDTATEIRNRFGIPVIFLTAHLDEERLQRAKIAMPFGYVLKPLQERELMVTLEMAMHTARAEAERRQADEKARKTDFQLRSIIENSTNLFFAHTPDHRLTYVSPQVSSILGYAPEETFMKWTDLATDNPINEIGFQQTIKAIESGKPQPPYELELIHQNGKKVWVEIREAPVVENGKTVQIVGALIDITERKQARAQMHLQSLVLSQIQDLVTVTDLDGVITYVNDAELRSLGYSRAELIGSSTEKYGEDLERGTTQRQILQETLAHGEWRGEVVNQTPEGREIIMDCRTFAVLDEQGNRVALAGIATDITARKRIEENLKQRVAIEQLTATCILSLAENQPFARRIAKVLDKLRYGVSVNRVYIFQNEELPGKGTCMSQRYESCDSLVEPQIGNPILQQLPYSENGALLLPLLQQKQHFAATVDGMDGAERENLESQGILSILIMPIFAGEDLWGFIGFDDCEHPRLWEDNDIDVLKTIADAIGIAIIGERQKERLMESEQKYRTLVNNTQQGAVIAQANPVRLRFANPAMTLISGYDEDELLAMGETLSPTLIHPDDRQRFFSSFKDRIAGKDVPKQDEYRIISKSGVTKWVSIHSSLIDYFGEPATLTTFMDITDHKRAEENLKESEKKYRTVIENATEAIIVLQGNGIEYLNPKTCELTGYSEAELHAKPFLDIVHPEDREMLVDKYLWRQNGEALDEIYTFRLVGKLNNVIWVEIKPVIVDWKGEVATLCFISDITVSKRTQELMVQTEKMLSLGNMAAGIAHELNNPLGAMLQGTQNVQRRLSTNLDRNTAVAKETGIDLEKLHHYLEKRGVLSMLDGIRDSGRKAAHIVSNMLQFSRKSESQMAPVDICALAEKAIELAGKGYNLERKYDFRNIRIEREFNPQLPPVPCTETEIEQVLLNLLNNAAWAMLSENRPDTPRIVIRIQPEAAMVRIEVEDNGPGIPKEIRAQIFEPFFTTKPAKDGTGLGLSVSYMIVVNNHRGTMEVESKPGRGSNFIFRLPLKRD
jgi:PAS domain S-box-containing protein